MSMALSAAGSPTGSGSECEAQGLKERWALDEETRMDLALLAEDAVRKGPSNGVVFSFWAARFAQASSLRPPQGARELAPEALRGSLFDWLSRSDSQGVKSARRRWPQALALAGALDFGPDGLDGEKAYAQACSLAARWIEAWHPDFDGAPHGFRTPQSQDLVAQARRGMCQAAIQTLFEFSEELGIESPVEKAKMIIARDGLRAKASSDHPGAFVFKKPAYVQKLALYMERCALEACASPGVSGPRPRL